MWNREGELTQPTTKQMIEPKSWPRCYRKDNWKIVPANTCTRIPFHSRYTAYVHSTHPFCYMYYKHRYITVECNTIHYICYNFFFAPEPSSLFKICGLFIDFLFRLLSPPFALTLLIDLIILPLSLVNATLDFDSYFQIHFKIHWHMRCSSLRPYIFWHT